MKVSTPHRPTWSLAWSPFNNHQNEWNDDYDGDDDDDNDDDDESTYPASIALNRANQNHGQLMVGENLVGQKMEKTGYQPYTIYDIGAFWQPSQKHEHVDDNEDDDNDYTCEGRTV